MKRSAAEAAEERAVLQARAQSAMDDLSRAEEQKAALYAQVDASVAKGALLRKDAEAAAELRATLKDVRGELDELKLKLEKVTLKEGKKKKFKKKLISTYIK